MKNDTRAYYERKVRMAVERIAASLDSALDFTELARAVALSPLHFHRIFRGMVGETALELHRRLRLERAAYQLLFTDASVTTVAFTAGYETHESFTRAFRAAYGKPPSEFRAERRAPLPCAQPEAFRLMARSGVHFTGHTVFTANLCLSTGDSTMDVVIEELPTLYTLCVRHVGPYNQIPDAFARLGSIAGPAGLIGLPQSMMLAVYHDAPEVTPADQLRADACLSVPQGTRAPEGLNELVIPGGRYARTTHVGPYAQLGDAWARFMGGWLPQSGHALGSGVTFEIYRNTPMDTPQDALRTDLYLPLA